MAAGLGLLPVLAALATATPPWRRPTIAGLCGLGSVVNVVLLIVLWHGFTLVALVTLLIVLLYVSVAWLEIHRR